jgi:hypothetical protein
MSDSSSSSREGSSVSLAGGGRLAFGDLTVTNADLLRGFLEARIQLMGIHEAILGLPDDGNPLRYFEKGVAPKKTSVTPSSASSSGQKRENPVTFESSEEEEDFSDEESDVDDDEEEDDEEEEVEERAPADVGPRKRHTWTKEQEVALVNARNLIGHNSWRKVYDFDMKKMEGTKLLVGLTNHQLKDKYREIMARGNKKVRSDD